MPELATIDEILEARVATLETELSEARAARAAAEAQNRAKDDFLSVFAHDLRSPISVIRMWSKLWQSGQLDAQRVQQAVEVIERSAETLTQLADDLVEISRVLAGKLTVRSERIDLAEPVRAALQSLASKATTRRLRVETTLVPVQVRGDAARLQQVAANLLGSAIKLTPSGGTVTVTLTVDGGTAILTVKDDGAGIAPDLLPFVFECFQQDEALSARLPSGLGLRLAVARKLVEAHSGSIEVHSEGDGKGITSVVKLPVASPSDSGAARAP